MRKTFIPLFTYLIVFLVFTSFSNARGVGSYKELPASLFSPQPESETVNTAALLFEEMNLEAAGLDSSVFTLALKGYERLKEQGRVNNDRYLTIIDMGKGSREKRFYLLDMEEGDLELHTYVSHGKNSGLDR
ncbi:MAG TPA: murein L,D-transpeptidase catalytic domain family protein, partial [Chitinophagaceae bacterium]|nr:murein L,D-transpeptidase catalytic domain family protein [Chitinophagaceae bacterium]